MFKWLEQYFTFTKGERNGVIALIFIAIAVLIAPSVYFYFKPVEHADNTRNEHEIKAFKKETEANDGTIINVANDSVRPTLVDTTRHYAKREFKDDKYFDFDPNKIGVEEWVKLGFSEKQAITIEHYKAKGAKFYKTEDLMKLFVMTPEHYAKLEPFVKIDVTALGARGYKRKSD